MTKGNLWQELSYLAMFTPWYSFTILSDDYEKKALLCRDYCDHKITSLLLFVHQYTTVQIIIAMASAFPCTLLLLWQVLLFLACFRPWPEIDMGGIGKVNLVLIITAVIISTRAAVSLLIFTKILKILIKS